MDNWWRLAIVQIISCFQTGVTCRAKKPTMVTRTSLDCILNAILLPLCRHLHPRVRHLHPRVVPTAWRACVAVDAPTFACRFSFVLFPRPPRLLPSQPPPSVGIGDTHTYPHQLDTLLCYWVQPLWHVSSSFMTACRPVLALLST